MAIPAQGLTFTWGSVTLSEVAEVEAAIQPGLPIGRTAIWSPNLGEVRLIGYSQTNLPGSDYGKRKRLTIQVALPNPPGGVETLFDSDCIYSGRDLTVRANDVVRFAYVFTVQDTLGAPSNP